MCYSFVLQVRSVNNDIDERVTLRQPEEDDVEGAEITGITYVQPAPVR